MKLNNRNENIIAISYALIYFIFNLFHISKIFSLSHDSIYYYSEIINRAFTLHPHHLLFIPFMTFVSDFLISTGLTQSNITAVTLVNTFVGTVILIIIYSILRKNLRQDFFTSLSAMLLISVSYGFWFYNLNIETYQMPMLFTFLSIYFITKKDSIKYSVFAALAGGTAVVFHQLYFLFFLVVLLYYVLTKGTQSLKRIVVFSLVFHSVWIIIYAFAVYNSDVHSITDLQKWFFKYHYVTNSWAKFDVSFIINPLVGLQRSFLTIHGLFLIDSVSENVMKLFPSKYLKDDIFIGMGLPKVYFYFYILSIFSLLITLFGIIFNKFKDFLKLINQIKEIKLLLIFLFIFSLFFIFWDASNLEFWLPQSIIITVLFVIIINIIKSKRTKLLIISMFYLLLLMNNYTITISRISDVRCDYYLSFLEQMKNKVPSNCVIIENDDWLISKYSAVYTKYEFLSYKNLIKNVNITELIKKYQYDNQSLIIEKSVFLKIYSPEQIKYLITDSFKIFEKSYYRIKKL